jgi:hypothetical protein
MENAVEDRMQCELFPPPPRALTCETATVIPVGFWGNPSAAEELWSDCLARPTPAGTAVEKLLDMCALFGLQRATNPPLSIANLAWTNGAFLTALHAPPEALKRLTGDDSAAAQALFEAVLQQGVQPDTEPTHLLQQRRLLQQALPADPVAHYGSLSNLIRVAAGAGWVAYNFPHLVTARTIHGGQLSYGQQFLGTQLIRLVDRWEPSLADDALIRFFGDHYAPRAKLECRTILAAATDSLARARRCAWTPREFLLDGHRRGRALARDWRSRAQAVLQEVPLSTRQFMRSTFQEHMGPSWRCATTDAAWDAMQSEFSHYNPRVISSPSLDSALILLRQAYDFLYWAGLLAETTPPERPCVIRLGAPQTPFPAN